MAWIQGGDELSEEWLSGENIHGPTPIELMQDDALKLPTRVSSGYNATRFSRPEDRPVSSRLLFRSLLLPLVIGLWIGLVVTQADGQAEEPVRLHSSMSRQSCCGIVRAATGGITRRGA